jgi:hypothetical protein
VGYIQEEYAVESSKLASDYQDNLKYKLVLWDI